MKGRHLLALVVSAAAWSLTPLFSLAAHAVTTADGSVAATCRRGTFKNFHDEGQPNVPPPGYTGPTFTLRQDYPDTRVPDAAEAKPWESIDVSPESLLTGGALAYLDAVYSYVSEGNVAVDWDVNRNKVRDWYHAPWMDATDDGREFVHGLTHELNSHPLLLGPGQKKWYQTWAVGAFNAPGGWAIGQMWCDPNAPDVDALNPDPNAPNEFPNGTAVWKLLFSTADPKELPFLKDSYEWSADIYKDFDPGTGKTPPGAPREIATVRLVQMDVAVRDDRLPNGWAFGTFAYSSDAPGKTPWERMVPIGLQWGYDPGVTPQMVADGTKLRESWLNPDFYGLPDNHRGWAGRLVGPMDNPESSCMSCHQTAGQPAFPLVPVPPPTNFVSGNSESTSTITAPPLSSRQRLPWFVNTPAGVSFGSQGRTSTDYSLQLSMGLQRFYLATCHPKVLDELYSVRDPFAKSPAAIAQDDCPDLATFASAADAARSPQSRDQGWWVVGAIAAVMVAVAALVSRRAALVSRRVKRPPVPPTYPEPPHEGNNQ